MIFAARPTSGDRPAFPQVLALLLTFMLFAVVPAPAQEDDAPAETAPETALPTPSAPGAVTLEDAPNDGGTALLVNWELSADDARRDLLTEYRVEQSTAGGDFVPVMVVAPTTTSLRQPGLSPDTTYQFRVVAVGPNGEAASPPSAGMNPVEQWFRADRLPVLIIMLVVCFAIMINIWRAHSGEKLYIRKIAGMDAVQEAVGRATEMGQPVLYISGIQDMDNVQTVAGITILGSISKMIAEYETSLIMPTSRSIVMSTARETVKEAYLSAGRPDAFREDSIYYVTDEQFGFVAHVDGLMLRKKPATCFYLGAFFAESLILAETGNSIGAIQVAGTAMPTQLPFFVAACDYTLIGEELFAASAYLSQDEKMLGSLKGQDFGKFIAMASIGVGALMATFASMTNAPIFTSVLNGLVWLWSG